MKAYSAERKEALVRRMMPPENASVSSLARETGITEKGHALAGRYKQKDAYDIYYCVRIYPDGIDALARECRLLLGHASGERGFRYIAEKFDTFEGYGPTCVRRFVEDTRAG